MKIGRLGGLVRRPAHGAAATRTGATRTGVTRMGGEDWSLEVQIHPSDIRKRVRYFFLSRVQVTFWSVLALLYLMALALAAGVAPTVIKGYLGKDDYQVLVAERARQGERLQDLLGRLDGIEERSRGLAGRVDKIFLVYGLPPVPAPGTAIEAKLEAGTGAAPERAALYAGAMEQGERRRQRISRRLRSLDLALKRAREFELAHPEQVRGTPALCPLRGEFVLVSPFGRRRNPFTRELELHAGLDLAAPLGSPVHATATGVVIWAGRYPLGRSAVWWRLGNVVAVRNTDDMVTLYGHLQEMRVRPGQRLERGDVLGTVGRSEVNNSVHLHYEIRRRAGTGEGSCGRRTP
jgi:murein DD-endopeptidase MepM/ murein hydrolase activator NlpD